MRYLGGEYITKHRDMEAILVVNGDLVSKCDRGHIQRILDVGALAKFNWEKPAQNKATFLQRSNHPFVSKYPETISKTVNKEEHNHQLVPLPSWVVKFLPYAHILLQIILLKTGKKAH